MTTTTAARFLPLAIGEQDAVAAALAPVTPDKLAHGIRTRIAAGELAVVRLPDGQTTPQTMGMDLLSWACIARHMDASAQGEHTLAAVLRFLSRELCRGTVCLVSLDDYRAQLAEALEHGSTVPTPEPLPTDGPRALRYGQGWAAGPLGRTYADHRLALHHEQAMAGMAHAWHRLQQEAG